jgi:predicted Co/Zn/Cd cation transporter (cation efflux family)
MNDGIRCAQKVAKISVITLLSIGLVELLIGQISGSVVATADGIDSLSDAMISFIVFMGLLIEISLWLLQSRESCRTYSSNRDDCYGINHLIPLIWFTAITR